MSVFMLVILIPLVLGGGIVTVKMLDQRQHDRHRRTYRLAFPRDLDAERVSAWIRSISGTLRPSSLHVSGSPTIVFELWATGEGMTHRVKVPWQHADYVIAQLRSLVPGIRVTPEDDYPREQWRRMVEVGLTNSARQLRIYSEADMAASLLASVQALGEDEAILIQWVVTPAIPTHPPVHREARSIEFKLEHLFKGNTAGRDEVNDRRSKLEEPNMMAVLRVAATAKTDVRADHLIYKVRAALASARGPSSRFVKRIVTNSALQRRIDNAAGSFNFPIQLSVPELTALVAWPIEAPQIVGLPRPMGRQFAPEGSIPSDGIRIGHSSFPGAERPIAIPYEGAGMHTEIIGETGCLHPNTPIYDPVDGSTKTVERRYLDAKPFHVFALDGERIIVARAETPVRYKKVGMYELYNDDTSIVVTGRHRVWDGHTYVELQQLYKRQSDVGVQLPSISGNDLSRLLSDAPHSMQRHAGCQGCCSCGCRRCGQPLRQGVDNDPAFVPSQACVPVPYSLSYDKDDQAHTLAYTRQHHTCIHPSKNNSSRRANHVREMAIRLALSISESLWKSRPCASVSDVHSTPGCTNQHTHQSAPDSTACRMATDGASHSLLHSEHVQPNNSRQLASVSLHCHNQHELAQESYQSFLEVKPFNLRFKDYFNNSTFWVKPASPETYYDFHVPQYENYLSCGLIHHNTGKSVVSDHIASQIMKAGHGLILMEASGNLYEMVLDHVPFNRIQDVILLDLSDKQYTVPFNVLDQGSSETVIDEIMDLFAYRYGTGIWSDEFILNGMRTLAENPSLTLMDLAPLLSPTSYELEWADNITRHVKDPELKRWWQRHENRGKNEQQKRSEPVLSRISQMSARPELRYMLGQPTSAFKMVDVFNSGKILLINLKGISAQSASFAGTLIMNAIWHAAQTSNRHRSNYTYMILDEFARFMDLPIDTESMLAEARKYKFGMFLAHQHMTQLKQSVRDGVISNARNKIIMAANNDDARLLSRELHGAVAVEDITNLQAYEAIASVMTSTGASGPVSITTQAPLPPYGVANRVRAYVRSTYAQPVSNVQADMANRYQVTKPSTRRPKISGSDSGWG